jgi:hypothetical protein
MHSENTGPVHTVLLKYLFLKIKTLVILRIYIGKLYMESHIQNWTHGL